MTMDLRQLERLLHKYIDGHTTEEEEAALKKALTGNEVPEQLKPMARLFGFFEAEKAIKPLGDKFDEQVLSQIKRRQNPARLGLLWKVAGVAAAVLVTVSLTYLAVNDRQLPEVAEDTYTDPRKAFEETKKALMMLSDRFNEGTRHVEKLETFNEVQEEIKMN